MRETTEKRTSSGNGYRWSMTTTKYGDESTCHGLTIDNLNVKNIADAENLFEEIFIRVRDILLNDATHKGNKFDVCHQVARDLSKDLKKK